MTSKEPTFSDLPNPDNVTGGIWVAEESPGSFVPVSREVGSEYIDELRFRIDEYKDQEGNIRGSLLTVSPKVSTPAWHILRNDRTESYLEVTRVVEGDGEFVVKSQSGATHVNSDIDVDTPAFQVKPGDTFQVTAGEKGVQLLTTFPQAPFILDNEERVEDIRHPHEPGQV